MNHFDDNELIDGLRAGLSNRTADVHAPDGFADDARRLAHLRATTRAVGAGIPTLAAAGVATVLLVGSSAPMAHMTIAPAAPSANTPGAQAREVAYIVKRVKAKVADDNPSETVFHDYSYPSGQETSDGSLVNLGKIYGDGYTYVASDGAEYSAGYIGGGSKPSGFGVIYPPMNGQVKDAQTFIDNINHTYSQQQTETPDPSNAPSETPASGTASNPAKVRQALQSGDVTQIGTTTINGMKAIALSMKVSSGASIQRLTLYIDARTYQPLREVSTVQNANGGQYAPGLYITDWLPATAHNIAMAKGPSVPAGYTKVEHAVPRG